MDGTDRRGWQELTARLREEIVLGRRYMRERLIEDEIIAETGATRHAVRRAFDELVGLGLAERQPNRGVRVRAYTRDEVEGLYEIRDALERRAALHFDRVADPSLVSELRALADAHAAASETGDFAAIFEANNAFHEALYGAAGNKYLAEAIMHYTVATQPIRTRAFPVVDERRIAVEDHFHMCKLIAEGRGADLADLNSRHIARPKALYLSTLPPE